jgi:hypothetical protein
MSILFKTSPFKPGKLIQPDQEPAYTRDVFSRFALYSPPGEECGYFVVNEDTNPDPVAAEFLNRHRIVKATLRKARPDELDVQEDIYQEVMHEIGQEVIKHAIDRVI